MTTGLISVRKWLASETAVSHLALHDHPLIGALNKPELTKEMYFSSLRVLLSVYQTIETQRRTLDILPAFNLARELNALRFDLGGEKPGPSHDMIGLSDNASMLGALYTAHGSAFGGAVIARNVAAILPNIPTTYFGLPPNPNRWRALIQSLEELAANSEGIKQLVDGADRAFRAVHSEADQHLRLFALKKVA